jgi:hypothetical protein
VKKEFAGTLFLHKFSQYDSLIGECGSARDAPRILPGLSGDVT